MVEPASGAATGFAVSKCYYAISALFMGMVVMFMRNKPTLKNHGRAASGAIVGGVSVGSGIIFGGAVAVYFGLDPNDANVALAVGGGIGLFAVGIITLVANLLDKTEDKDLLEVVQEVRAVVSPKKLTPAKKAVATKTVRSVRAKAAK
jgi:hypothetical protein